MKDIEYIDVTSDSFEIKQIIYDSRKTTEMFYDSVIIKSTHIRRVKNSLDNLFFELLLQFHDKVIMLNFYEVSDIISTSTLSCFPEIREIKIVHKNNFSTCEFIPMWSNKSINFKFNDFKMKSCSLA